LEQKLSMNFKESSIYFISYLRKLVIKSMENGSSKSNYYVNFVEILVVSLKGIAAIGDEAVLEKVGSNDKYLITKLNQNKITLEKIDRYKSFNLFLFIIKLN
jgi:hypothetical protein